jgi:small subunit ribosomal protein S17
MYVRVRKRYKAHDEKNEYKAGDRVEIVEHKPYSKEKRWKVARLIERPAQELS